jgi:beta-phosphoglucomutase
MDIKAFIFDLDGVITDTAEFHYLAWKRLADEEGVPFDRTDNDQLRGVSRRESLNRLLKGRAIDEATAEVWLERKNVYYREHLRTITPDYVLPGVRRFLDEAQRAGLRLGIGSASKNAREVLERLDMLDRFGALGDGHVVNNTKPAPDLFVWVAGRLGVTVSEAVVFEDAEAGVAAALNGGFRVVGLGPADVSRAHVVLPGLTDARVVDLLAELKRIAG